MSTMVGVKYVSCRFKFGVGVGVCVVLVSFFACSLARAVSGVALNWNPNADPSVVGYNVYYGGGSRIYTNMVNAGTSTNIAVNGLMEGKTYYFAVTAYTIDGLESDYSDEFVYLVPGYLTLTSGATPADPLQIRFPVAAGHDYELQESTDLVTWTTFGQTTGVSNVWVEFDVTRNASGAAFYRVISH